MTGPAVERFYKQVTVVAEADGFVLRLDSWPLRTPAKAPLRLPTRALADAIAAEWAAQEARIDPLSMPMMSLICTALDRIAPQRETFAAEIAAYGAHDLLCYREAQYHGLTERQQQIWQPLLDWAAITFDAQLTVTAGVVPVEQPAAAVAALCSAVTALDLLELTVLGHVTMATGSLVIGLALLHGRQDAAAAFAAATLDETYQIEKWGEDAEATARRAALETDLQAAARFQTLIRS